MPRFLSDEWFEKVRELNEASRSIDIAPAMRDIVVNLTVSTPAGEVLMCLDRGFMVKGHGPSPDVRMSMPADYALAILVRGDWSAGMKGWVRRRIKLSGDMRKLIPLQVRSPTSDEEALRRRIEAFTE